MWGIDEDGECLLIIDKNFLAYCYVVLEESENPQEVMDRIMLQKADFPSLVKLEPVKRIFFGRPIKAIKVIFQNPDIVPKYAKF